MIMNMQMTSNEVWNMYICLGYIVFVSTRITQIKTFPFDLLGENNTESSERAICVRIIIDEIGKVFT